MPIEHDCGPRCQCDNCSGCIRWGSKCVIILSPAPGGNPQEAIEIPGEKLSLQEKVTISVSNISLADVAVYLGNLSRDPIGIPAERARDQVKLKAKNKPLLEIVEKLGLVKLPRKRSSRTSAT